MAQRGQSLQAGGQVVVGASVRHFDQASRSQLFQLFALEALSDWSMRLALAGDSSQQPMCIDYVHTEYLLNPTARLRA
ncbi:MAG: hypothetical protein ABIS71_04575 [Chthoniobacterales bacterium]